MIQENELAMFFVSIWVLVYAWKIRLINIPEHRYFLSGFYLLLAGLIFTLLESFVGNHYLNILEHFCYAFSSVLLAIWSIRSCFFQR